VTLAGRRDLSAAGRLVAQRDISHMLGADSGDWKTSKQTHFLRLANEVWSGKQKGQPLVD
jgi:hypothetical protein